MLQFIAVLVVSSDPTFIKACSEGLWRVFIAQSVQEARAIIEGPQGADIRAALIDTTPGISGVVQELLNRQVIVVRRQPVTFKPKRDDWPRADLMGLRCFNMEIRHVAEVLQMFSEAVEELLRLKKEATVSPIQPEEDYVLVVEDDETTLELFQAFFSRMGLEVQFKSARTLFEARTLVAKRKPLFVILDGEVLDGKIPQTNEFAGELYEAAIPFFRFSGRAAAQPFPQVSHRGLGVLMKPTDMGRIVRYAEYIICLLHGIEVPKPPSRE